MPPSSTSASNQTLNHPPSSSAPPDLHHMPASPKSHTSNMSSIREESAPIADASALEITKPTRAGFTFLSLPPEIRNMIYHYIFTPVRDGKCWMIHANFDNDHLKGLRRDCYRCKLQQPHNTCRPKYKEELGWYPTWYLTRDRIHLSVLQTSRTILEEAAPISLAHIHICTDSFFDICELHQRSLETFLMVLARRRGPSLPKLTYTCYGYDWEPDANHARHLLQSINGFDIRIECFEIQEFWSTPPQPEALTVVWITGLNPPMSRFFEKQRTEFNEAAQLWLAKLVNAKAADANARLPLFRDFLPQYFDQSSD
ncbi:hypothetical protein KCU99_g9006, partial [Aureobasidium melanogenum]